MIELRKDSLKFSFPEVHPRAKLDIQFLRTLRIPDDGREYPLPPGLGRFPLAHVDDFAERVPQRWLTRGGVMLPIYQAEALWIDFDCDRDGWMGIPYPFAIKVAAGKINAVTGKEWEPGLSASKQNYMVAPEQPWLDGYCVEQGVIRQFVAMPLGEGYTAEEQITGEGQHGGLQIEVYPMKRDLFERRFGREGREVRAGIVASMDMCLSRGSGDMGLAPGGRMRQVIFDDPYGVGYWDQENTSRCFVSLANSMVWRSIAGEQPPPTPVTAETYERFGLPWFDYYGEGTALQGSKILSRLKSVAQMGAGKGRNPLPENESVTPGQVVQLRRGLSPEQVREGSF